MDAILQDEHYANLCILLIPTALLFVIVNWGGFKYFASQSSFSFLWQAILIRLGKQMHGIDQKKRESICVLRLR